LSIRTTIRYSNQHYIDSYRIPEAADDDESVEALFDSSHSYFGQLNAYLDATVIDGGDTDNQRGVGGEQMKTVRANREAGPKKLSKPDPINPSHYKSHPSGVECYQIAEWWPFHLGVALRYMWRVDDKDDPVVNLRKAIWHLEKEIARRERIARRNWAICRPVGIKSHE
jgi:hypothetical protein